MVGFNRRFAPLLTEMRDKFGAWPRQLGDPVPGQRGPAGRREPADQPGAGGLPVHRRGGPLHLAARPADSLPEEVYAIRGPAHDEEQAVIKMAQPVQRHHHLRHGRQRPVSEGERWDSCWRRLNAGPDNFTKAGVWVGRKQTPPAFGAAALRRAQQREIAAFAEGLSGAAGRCRYHWEPPPPTSATIAAPDSRPSGRPEPAASVDNLILLPARVVRLPGRPDVARRGGPGSARYQGAQLAWSRRQVKRGGATGGAAHDGSAAVYGHAAARRPPCGPGPAAVLAAADRLMQGGRASARRPAHHSVQPDWFRDPVTGRRSEPDRYVFRINHRSEEQVGNVKQLWGDLRLQHLTLLATAWYLSQDERYARRVDQQLRSWWQDNPFLSGVHWTSGIETGHPADQPGLDPAAAGFLARRPRPSRGNDLAVQQIRWHPAVPGRLPSRGSSASNHVPSRREPASWWRAAPSAGFAESATWQRRGPPGCWNVSRRPTRSRPGSAASWPPITRVSWPSWRCRPRWRPPRLAIPRPLTCGWRTGSHG